MPALCLNRSMTNEELSQQIAVLTTTVTEKFNEIDKRFEQIDKRLEQIETRFEGIDGRLDKLQAGQDDLRTKYGEMNEKQGYIVNAQKTIAKMQADLQHTVEEQGAKLEEDFTDMKATQASIQHDIARINRKMVVEAGVRDTCTRASSPRKTATTATLTVASAWWKPTSLIWGSRERRYGWHGTRHGSNPTIARITRRSGCHRPSRA